MWITNPGNNSKTPDPSLDQHTQVNIRFRHETHHDDTSFDNSGVIGEWYWLNDGDDSDIVEYQIIRE